MGQLALHRSASIIVEPVERTTTADAIGSGYPSGTGAIVGRAATTAQRVDGLVRARPAPWDEHLTPLGFLDRVPLTELSRGSLRPSTYNGASLRRVSGFAGVGRNKTRAEGQADRFGAG